MNILFINETDCIVNASGGIMRVSQQLCNYFTSKQYKCYSGYFNQQEGQPAPFDGRIQLVTPFNDTEFENFLVANQIDIIITTLWTRKNLETLKNIFKIATSLHIKVLYEVHVMPGHELVQSIPFDKLLYQIKYRQNVKLHCIKWLLHTGSFLLKPFYTKQLRAKYLIPFNNCDKAIVLSQYYIRKYASLIGTEYISKITAIGNALTYSEFASEELIQQKRKEILMVGRLYEFDKRFSAALKIWKKVEQNPLLSDWNLTIIGEGEDKSYYHYLSQKLKLQRVTFAGRQNPYDYYRRASIIMMTSTAEGWPMVLMEAAQMGVPAIAFDSFDALHEIVTDNHSGIIVPNNNIKLYYEKLANLMLDDAKREQMALAAVEDSKRFTTDKIMAKWEALLKECDTK